MKKTLLISFLIMTSSYANARCNGNYADHLLGARFSNCGAEFIESVHNVEGYYAAVSGVCASGCYNAIFNAELRPECDVSYANVLKSYPQIIQIAQSNSCTDSGSYTGEPVEPDLSPNANCRWLTRHTVQVNCGGGAPDQNICGAGGKRVCSGEVVCSSEFNHQGQKVPAGAYAASCLSKTGSCESVSMEECFNDTHTAVTEDGHYDRAITPAVQRAKGIN